ncbi:MAG: response regulator [Myxococcales bacterium]|nr:response regulator [Myxococcales bacterium]
MDRPRVLIVEDEASVRMTLEALLSDTYSVVSVGTAASARWNLVHQEFDVLITDYSLPDGNGAELISSMELSAPELIAIVVTGYPDAPDVRALRRNSGMVLGKPYDPEVLLAYVRNAAQFARLRRAPKRLQGAVGGG